MYLDPDVVPPLAGLRLYANLGIFHHAFSVPSVCMFETAHCSLIIIIGLSRYRLKLGVVDLHSFNVDLDSDFRSLNLNYKARTSSILKKYLIFGSLLITKFKKIKETSLKSRIFPLKKN
jgi:hypothetical protein